MKNENNTPILLLLRFFTMKGRFKYIFRKFTALPCAIYISPQKKLFLEPNQSS